MPIPPNLPEAQLELIFKDMRAAHRKEFGDVGPHPDETIIVCGCGTCQDAYEAALRIAEQTLEHDCGLWLFAVAKHLESMGRIAIARMIDANPKIGEAHFQGALLTIEHLASDAALIQNHPENIERQWRTIGNVITKNT
jgi:hypothetical protein